MTKIAFCSDLHLEFKPIDLINEENADVLILSGDIMISEWLHQFPADQDNTTIVSTYQLQAWRFREFLQECSDQFPHVIYVAGNHEFYHGKWYAGLDYLKEECARYPNVHFLENKTFKLDDVLFIGSTLWTDCHKGDPLTIYQLGFSMNDFKIIKNDRSGFRKLEVMETVRRHHQAMDFIEPTVENATSNTKVVVCTHHSPSYLGIVDRYKDDYEINGGYHSDLSTFITANPNIKVWIHGHTHELLDYVLGETRILCNPRGYAGWDATADTFKLKYIEV